MDRNGEGRGVQCCLFCGVTKGFHVRYVAPMNVGICPACEVKLIRQELNRRDLLPEVVASMGEGL
jgi:hypothetical protein